MDLTREKRVTIGIVGGGAAGMTAAIAAAGQGAAVTLFERNDRLGKKILATGNGKCNLGNRDMGIDKYSTENPELLQGYLERFGIKDTLAFFKGLGLMIKEKNGYLYPLSEQAASVLDVLRYAIEREPLIRVESESCIDRIERDGNKNCVRLWSGSREFRFDRVILACGGKAAPKTGSDGAGYRLAGMLGHGLIPVVPALVQLKCREEWFKAVSGVRVDAKLSLMQKGKVLTEERGELQLTDYGISGIPVFQMSRKVNYILREQREVEVKIDFLPDYAGEDFAEELMRSRAFIKKHGTVEAYFSGMLNKKLMSLFIKLAGLKPGGGAAEAPSAALERVFGFCRELSVHVTGSNSFDSAQVCAGGIPLLEVTEQLESRLAPGVYLVGELLDVDGRCGGYNLHWAWCSGYLAGTAAAQSKLVETAVAQLNLAGTAGAQLNLAGTAAAQSKRDRIENRKKVEK